MASIREAEGSGAGAQSAPPILDVRELVVRFGGIVALDGVSFTMASGQILAVIGPNGSGKTTFFNCLSRLYTPNSGDVLFEGRTILDRPPHRIAEIRIGRTFQNLALFQTMTVLDNILIGGHARTSSDYVSDSLGLRWVRRQERDLERKAWDLIDYLNLHDVAHRPIAGLPFGTQKRVELARALAINPKLLLLDEPAGGLSHEEVQKFAQMVRQIRDERQISVLLVEHQMNLVMSLSDKVVVLNFGRKIAEGTPAQVQKDPEVIEAYLGADHK